MKLYYSPGACSLAPHIVACEVGIPLELVRVDIPTKKTAAGDDYWKINPKGYVPAMELDDGQVITEVGVICQYLADLKPESGLVAKAGTTERYQQMSALNFVATEVHKQIGALFNPQMTAEMKVVQTATIERRLKALEASLEKQPYVAGERYTVADAYLFTALSWAGLVKLDLSKWVNIPAFMARVADRSGVRAAMKTEGLLK
ncbi:glutathione transferase GstA [Noviherbaspirillum sedimenti]|uniref:Glutathione transferase GstA n=1 Tax=Noviherbaspirillum sedimenti TaxID=2320865 RepID=A0A3A3FW33_9BURK|nr:glutathione transferase GstA [Noviherbaspirillum sedimenti]RJG00413.1 glutathione transferase GstA [Noviherbaspirillum sedimenti]